MTLLVLGESCGVYFYEALAVLGIDDHTSRDNARRAYLRLLKQHKPEQDPEGFKRVREAYDLVRDILPEVEIPRDAPEEQADRHEPPDEPPRSEPVRGGDFATDDVEPPVSSHRGPPPSSAPSRREVSDLVEREPEASARAGLSVELSPPPSDPEPPLSGASGEQPSEGEPPESIPDWATLYQRAEEAESASDWPLVFAALELAAKHVDAPEPPITATLRMMLRCIHDEEDQGHDRLFGALTHWIETTGLEARALRGERVLLWTVVRELRDVGGKLPPAIARGIVDATLSGAIERAHPVFARHAEKFPDETSAAAVLLVETAPYLGRTFGLMLRVSAPKAVFVPPAPPEPTPESFDGWRFVLPVIAAFLLMMRLVLKSEPSAPYTPLDPNKYKFVAPPTLPSFDLHLYQAPEHSALMWARILKQDPLNIAEPALRVATVDLSLKIEMGDCDRARGSFDKYVLLLDGSGARLEDHRRSYTEKLGEYLHQWCPRATDAGSDAKTDANTDAKADARGVPLE